jgi:hypothetical protein
VSLDGAGLLAEPNGMAADRLWRDHIQRQNWENELMALLAACAARSVQRSKAALPNGWAEAPGDPIRTQGAI